MEIEAELMSNKPVDNSRVALSTLISPRSMLERIALFILLICGKSADCNFSSSNKHSSSASKPLSVKRRNEIVRRQ